MSIVKLRTVKAKFTMIIVMMVLSISIHPKMTLNATNSEPESEQTYGELLKEMNIVNGDNSGDLMEEKSLNRAELAVLLCRLNGVGDMLESQEDELSFGDVNVSDWFYEYVSYCVDAGWLEGMSDHVFLPHGAVSEEMITTTLLRVLGYTPDWGLATSISKTMKCEVKVINSDVILRKEVFEYIYLFLGQRLKGSRATLAETINVEVSGIHQGINPTDYVIRRTNELEESEYINLHGEIVKDSDLIHTHTGRNSINYKNGIYHYVTENGEDITDCVYTSYICEKSTGTSNEGCYMLYNSEEYVKINDDYKVVRHDKFPVIEGYTLKRITYSYLEYMKVSEDTNWATTILVDYNGDILLEPQEGYEYQKDCFYVEPIDQRLLKVYFYEAHTGVEKNYLGVFDLERNEYILELEEGLKISKISDSELLIVQQEESGTKIQILNFLTMAETESLLQKENVVVSWRYNTEYGLIYSYDTNPLQAEVINKEYEVVYNLECESVYWFYDDMLLYEKEGKCSVINVDGTIIIPFEYEVVHKVIGKTSSGIILSKDGKEYIFETNNPVIIEQNRDQTDWRKEETVLPSNLLIKYVDGLGYTLETQDGEQIFMYVYSTMNYINEMGVIIAKTGRDSELTRIYDIYGNKIQAFDKYHSIEVFKDIYFQVFDGENSWIVDETDRVIYGPFRGDVTVLFSESIYQEIKF